MRLLNFSSFPQLISKCVVRLLLALITLAVFGAAATAQDIQYTKDSVDKNKRSSLYG